MVWNLGCIRVSAVTKAWITSPPWRGRTWCWCTTSSWRCWTPTRRPAAARRPRPRPALTPTSTSSSILRRRLTCSPAQSRPSPPAPPSLHRDTPTPSSWSGTSRPSPPHPHRPHRRLGGLKWTAMRKFQCQLIQSFSRLVSRLVFKLCTFVSLFLSFARTEGRMKSYGR